MRGVILSLYGLALALAPLVSAALPIQEEPLTPDNFKATTEKGLWLIEHFSPYCGHCKHFLPTWQQLVKDVANDPAQPSVYLAQVDCAMHGDLCNANGVKGYPQLNMYHNGEMVEQFREARELDVLKAFIQKHRDTVSEPVEPPPTTEAAAPVVLNPTGTVLALDDKLLTETLALGPAFIKFYAPWCGHCKKLSPTWKLLAQHMQNRLTIAEVDCEAHPAICKSFNINGYPTLVYVNQAGVRSEYNSGRKLEQLTAFVEKASAPSMVAIKPDELEARVKEDEVAYLLLHPADDTALLASVAQAASPLLGSPRIYTSPTAIFLSRFSLPSSAQWAVIALKDHDAVTPSSIFYGTSVTGLTAAETVGLGRWLLANRLPTVVELTQDSFQTVMNAPQSPLVVIAAAHGQSMKGQVQEKLRDVAAKWRAKTAGTGRAGAKDATDLGGREVVFASMDAARWGDWMKSMYGVKDAKVHDVDDVPVVIADHKNLIYFDEDGHGSTMRLSASSILPAVEGAVSGQLSPKNSENILERMARYVNSKIMLAEAYIVEHPWHLLLIIVAAVGMIGWVVKRVIFDAPTDEYGYQKGRLD
ncbi:thioredoxin-like protein [Schizophyllum amplum]|uniref:Thioredoxin-like protein n=1 Tax=Schizophyllum amplum TaxID=97359 RepID=A0A550CUZ0_9AGAR|nr:thioredoxin-like protein [Auriculariopsis ampla]